jgi:tetratricopeptide (TPR) repeat protein
MYRLIASSVLFVGASAVLASEQVGAPLIPNIVGGVESYYERGESWLVTNRAWSAWRKNGDRSAINDLIAQAKSGSVDAQLYIGYLLDNGEGVSADSRSAVGYFRSASATSVLARYNLGVLYQYGRGVDKNEETAKDYFLTATEIPAANVQLAVYFLKRENFDSAAKYATRAKVYGLPIAFYLLGRLEFEARRYFQAEALLSKAAAASEPNSALLLSRLYGDGLVGKANPMLSAMWAHIYQGLTGSTTSVASFSGGLTDHQAQEAFSRAQRWLATHSAQEKIAYSKTIFEKPISTLTRRD